MKKLGLLILLLMNQMVYSQPAKEFAVYEDSLKIILGKLYNSKADFERYNYNNQFNELLLKVLKEDNSFDYPFDSLNTIAHLTSPDKNFRIFNWDIALDNGTFLYDGYIQKYNSTKKKWDIFHLIDKSSEITGPESATLSPDNWFGALYYKIVEVKTESRTYYTLLGWDGNNRTSRKKIIEVLYFKTNGVPVFGYNLFRKFGQKNTRVIFEFSSNVSMSLKYEWQQMDKLISKPREKKQYKKVKSQFIVFDRLVPMDPSLVGMFQYYVPETNIFDGFMLENDRWVFVKDIDARNPFKKKKEQPKEVEHKVLYKPE
ncbi:MAG: hypothetical protein WCH34_15650 [Bacteroidota bacterium]